MLAGVVWNLSRILPKVNHMNETYCWASCW